MIGECCSILPFIALSQLILVLAILVEPRLNYIKKSKTYMCLRDVGRRFALLGRHIGTHSLELETSFALLIINKLLINFGSFNLKIFMQVLIPEYDIVRILVLIGDESFDIRVDFLIFSVISEDRLSWSHLKFAVGVIMDCIILLSQMPCPIMIEFLFIGGSPEHCT